MTMPNFLIIGDVKAGSTSLYHYLRQHPDVYMPSELKELRYFAYDKDNPYHVQAKSSRVKTLDEYLSYFENHTHEKAVGEASPNYLRSPLAAEKINSAIPDVKLIVCLRNPADRLFSLYLMQKRSGYTKKTFAEQAFSENAAWIKANFYWQDLKRYFDLFDEGQIKVILFDDLITDTLAVARELYQFLNVDDAFAPNLAVQNKGGLPKHRYVYSLLGSVKNSLKRMMNPPDKLRTIWANIRDKSLEEIKINLQTKRKILEICKDDILRTQELVKRDLSVWLRQ